MYVVEDGLLVEREVNIHKMTSTTVIFSGLEEKDMVVTEPLINVSEGTNAEILN